MTVATGLDLVCPACRADLIDEACAGCGRSFPPVAGLHDLRLASDRYLDLPAERAKADRLAKIAETTDLAGAARAYYAMTQDVDPPRCRRFLRHILGAEARGEAVADGLDEAGPILEVGCGTGGLLVAAKRRGLTIAGVDVASRWLVVARRRLDDRGLSVPLVAASADRLPYRDGTFATVVADSLVEHLDDPSAALREWRRVLRPEGRLLIWSPNRLSLLPDPHVRLWGVGFLPRRVAESYVRARRGGAWLPRCLSAGGAGRLVGSAGFEAVRVEPTDMGRVGMAAMAAHYDRARRFGPTRAILRALGPLWSVEAKAPAGADS